MNLWPHLSTREREWVERGVSLLGVDRDDLLHRLTPLRDRAILRRFRMLQQQVELGSNERTTNHDLYQRIICDMALAMTPDAIRKICERAAQNGNPCPDTVFP